MNTIRTFRPLLWVILPALSLACSSLETHTAKDPQADLSKYKTYAWAPEPSVAASRPRVLLDQSVKSSVEKELSAKGIQRAPSGTQPDMLVSYFGSSRDVVYGSSAPTYGHSGYYGYGYPYYGPNTTYTSRVGNLTIQFIDPKNKRIVWQGTASDVIGEAGADQKQVANAVNKLFEKYPVA